MYNHYKQNKDNKEIENKLADVIRTVMFLDRENKDMVGNMARLIMNKFILIERNNSVNC